jgi:hypothetical protein
MEYEVKWSATARSDFVSFGVTDELRHALLAASDKIEELLRGDPRSSASYMRLASTWMLVEKPLGVVYDILEADQIVYISSVWLVK